MKPASEQPATPEFEHQPDTFSVWGRIRSEAAYWKTQFSLLLPQQTPKPRKGWKQPQHAAPVRVEHFEKREMMSATNPLVETTVVHDTFDTLDTDTWQVDANKEHDTAAYTENGSLVLENMAGISQKEGTLPTPEAPVTIHGFWTPVSDQQSNTHAMTMRLRTNGDMDQHPQNCIQLVAYTNLDVFLTKKTDDFYGKIAEDKSKALKLGQTYEFTVTDNGHTVSVELKDANGNSVINLSADAPYAEAGTGDKMILFSRDNGVSKFDDLSITTMREAPPAEPEPEAEEIDGEAADEVLSALADSLDDPEYMFALQEAHLIEKQEAIAVLEQELQAAQTERDTMATVPETLTPTFRLSKPINSTNVTLVYEDVAAGSKLQIRKADGTTVTTDETLNQMSGTVSLHNQYYNDRVKHTVYIVAPDGTESYMGYWETIWGKNMGRNDLVMPEAEQAKLTYENPLYAQFVTNRNNTDVQIATLNQKIAQLNTEVTQLEAEMAETLAEMGDGATETYENQQRINELNQSIAALDEEIAIRGHDAFAIVDSARDEFYNVEDWDFMSGDTVEVRNNAVQFGGNAYLQYLDSPARQAGLRKMTTIDISMQSNERFIWLPQATAEDYRAGQRIDIMTGQYVGIYGPQGEHHINGNVPAGNFTIQVIETDSCVAVTVTDTNGKDYQFTFDPTTSGGTTAPAMYAWKNVTVRSVDTSLQSAETIGVQRQRLVRELNELQADEPSAEEELVSAYVKLDTEESRLAAFEAKKISLQRQSDDLLLQMNDLETQLAQATDADDIAALTAQHAAAQERRYLLQREMVPYSKMHARANNTLAPDNFRDKAEFVVQYMSDRPQTYFEVTLQGEPGAIIRKTVEHPGGETDGEIRFDIRRHEGGNGNGNVQIFMYADESKTELLDVFSGVYVRHTATTKGESGGTWGDLETGRIVENALDPAMSVLRINGPIVSIAAQTPYDHTRIELEGGGYFSTSDLQLEGGSQYQLRSFVMNGDAPSGTYKLRMLEGNNGMEVCSLTFEWDANSKVLTQVGDNHEITHMNTGLVDEETANAQRLTDRMAALDDISVSFGSLRLTQQTYLFWNSKFVKTDAEKQEIHDRFALPGHPDHGSIFKEGMTAWEESIGELLQHGVEAAVAAWNGDSQAEARAHFDEQYARVSTYRYVVEFALSFGESLPSADEIFAESLRIAQEKVDLLHEQQAKNEQMIKRDTYLASRDLGKTTDTSSRPSQAAIEHNLRAIAEAHGTDSEQYKNYLSHIGVPDLGEETYVLSDNTGQVLSEGFGEMTLPEINGTSMERITLDQRGAFTFSFSITEEKMVNVWTKGMGMRNVDLEITGDNLEQKYASDKMGPAGESISIKLTPGHYAVIVKDATNYNGGSMATGDFPVDVHYSMETYNSTEISGRISIPERSDTMPVRMRVAEFDGDTRNINYDRSPSDGGVNKLDPSKPVWIVIHGMNSSEDSPVIKDLAAAFGQHANTHDFQVVTLDWNEAAKDGVFIQDAPWTVAVGKWAAHQLQSIGFEAGQINVAGWSHGSYVAYEMGAELQRNTSSTLNTLIALDAATNIPAFSQYNHEPVDFSAISKHSLALDSSIVAGSNTLASTADVAFKIRSDHTTTTTTRHRHAVSVLSSILNGSGAASTEFTQKLGIETLLSGSFVNEYEKDIFGDVFEGVIDVQMSTENPDNATPTRMILDINDL